MVGAAAGAFGAQVQSLAWARRKAVAAGQAKAMAILMRRTLLMIWAPISRSLSQPPPACSGRRLWCRGRAERAGREERRIRTMLKSSKIPTGQTLENFDFAFQPAIERSRIETLATGAWIRNAEVLLLQGPPGVGKSHLLVGLGVRAIQLGFSVQYFRFDELLTALKADAPLRPARLKARKYMSTALLLVDEMGYDPMTRDEASLFFRLVSYRYGRGAMIITTNKSIRDWTELLAGDEVLATATLDRLLHRAHVLNIKGRSYRLRDLEDALKA
jgi:DNA replication protein DnaC